MKHLRKLWQDQNAAYLFQRPHAQVVHVFHTIGLRGTMMPSDDCVLMLALWLLPQAYEKYYPEQEEGQPQTGETLMMSIKVLRPYT